MIRGLMLGGEAGWGLYSIAMGSCQNVPVGGGALVMLWMEVGDRGGWLIADKQVRRGLSYRASSFLIGLSDLVDHLSTTEARSCNKGAALDKYLELPYLTVLRQ